MWSPRRGLVAKAVDVATLLLLINLIFTGTFSGVHATTREIIGEKSTGTKQMCSDLPVEFAAPVSRGPLALKIKRESKGVFLVVAVESSSPASGSLLIGDKVLVVDGLNTRDM